MTPIYPSMDSPEFTAAFDGFVNEIARLGRLFDEIGVRRSSDAQAGRQAVSTYEDVTRLVNGIIEQSRTLGSYVGCATSVDARDEVARAAESSLNAHRVKLEQLLTRYVAWVGTMDIDALAKASPLAREHSYYLTKARYSAGHQMSEEEESLAAALRPSSISGWARLHGEISAMMTAEVELGGETKVLPISKVRSLGGDPDRAVRKAGYEAEQKAWERMSVPFAAAMNGVKGFQQTVRSRRSYMNDLEPTFMQNGIDRAILEAMHTACVETFPDIRRYFAAKARVLGLSKLAWYDLNAPVGADTKKWSWPEAEEFVLRNFGNYSLRMAEFADRAFKGNWIDAEPRLGKEGGAYCSGIRPGTSRIMMNFDGSFSSVSTLAHELGHAYHNLNLGSKTALQRDTPMTLAETASIFCETLSFDSALQTAAPDDKLVLLETSLQRDSQVVVDIHSRFLFESRVFERRSARDLNVVEFNELMLAAQKETYGEGLESYHPYMWAVKGHYYGPTFYNYPYTFGLLFGVGLYAKYKEDPSNFRESYDEFLASTGMANAGTLAERFGIDIRSVGFWRKSLDHIRTQIAEFEELVGKF
jgi:pepF/M3 family oligoendopeptidase